MSAEDFAKIGTGGSKRTEIIGDFDSKSPVVLEWPLALTELSFLCNSLPECSFIECLALIQ